MEIHSPASTHDDVLQAARSLEQALLRHFEQDGQDSPAVLLAEAESAYAQGELRRARSLVASALPSSPPAATRTALYHLLGRVDTWEAPLESYELLMTEGEAVAETDVGRAATMLADAAVAAWVAGEPELGRAAGERSRALASGLGADIEATAELAHGIVLLALAPSEGRRLITQATRHFATHAPEKLPPSQTALALLWLDEYDAARVLLEASVDQGRRTGARTLSNAVDTLAVVDFKTGRWPAAAARSAEALRLALDRGEAVQAASCRTTLARTAAARGREAECREHLFAAAQVASENVLIAAYAMTAAGLLELGLDRPDAAVSELEWLVEPDVGRDPSLFDWETDLIEGYARAGRTADAHEALERFEQRAHETRRPSAKAAVARSRGLVASASRIDTEFETALRIQASLPTLFERARTELCYGERLRRARRRADARPHLQSALGTFERLGASTWAERARRELAATRGRSRPYSLDPAEFLTPHELQVASLVQRGLSNRAIAGTLFVAERTVEYHLTNIYRKLQIRSRTQLAALLARR